MNVTQVMYSVVRNPTNRLVQDPWKTKKSVNLIGVMLNLITSLISVSLCNVILILCRQRNISVMLKLKI